MFKEQFCQEKQNSPEKKCVQNKIHPQEKVSVFHRILTNHYLFNLNFLSETRRTWQEHTSEKRNKNIHKLSYNTYITESLCVISFQKYKCIPESESKNREHAK